MKSTSCCSAQMVKRSLRAAVQVSSCLALLSLEYSYMSLRLNTLLWIFVKSHYLFGCPYTEQIYELQVLLRLQELNLGSIGFEAALLTIRQPPRPVAICRCQWRLVLLILCNKKAGRYSIIKTIDLIFAQQ